MKTFAPPLSSFFLEQSPMDSLRKVATILMCPPIHYGVEYEINPWMSVANGPDLSRAHSSWEALRAMIECLGALVLLIEPGRNLPDLVFSANAGLVFDRSFIPSSFRHKERQGEQPLWEAWFGAAGFTIHRLPNGMVFEGAGDALFAGNLLIGGHGFRSDLKAYDAIRNMLHCDVLPVHLTDDRFYHLDTCFCPLDHKTAIFFPGAFAPESRADLEKRLTCLPVPEEEAVRFACNAIVIDKNVILPDGCPKTERLLLNAGYDTHSVDMSEFLKSGGACKCLTIRVQ